MARILLIDDQPDLLMVMDKALSEDSHEVTAVGDGAYVLNGSTGVDFDLAVTDMIMPGAEGMETLAYLRRSNPEIGVVVISGGGQISQRFHLNLALQSGALATLEKPFSMKRFVQVVREVLDRLSGAEGADTDLPPAPQLPRSCRCFF